MLCSGVFCFLGCVTCDSVPDFFLISLSTMSKNKRHNSTKFVICHSKSLSRTNLSLTNQEHSIVIIRIFCHMLGVKQFNFSFSYTHLINIHPSISFLLRLNNSFLETSDRRTSFRSTPTHDSERSTSLDAAKNGNQVYLVCR